MNEFIELAFTGPVWPASVMLMLLLAYSVLVFFGLADSAMDPPDFGTGDPSVDVSDSFTSVGTMSIRWLNLDSVPIFIWFGVFGLCWWLISLGLWDWFDSARYQPIVTTSLLLALRNVVIAAGVTKLLTKPMRSWFERGRAYSAEVLIGETCEIQTGEANGDYGRAKYKTDGAPLLLNVKTRGELLIKGQLAEIVDFDPEKRIYIVQSIEAVE